MKGRFVGAEKYGVMPVFDLRWRFEYLNRPSKYGMWNGPGDGRFPDTLAHCQTKENLAFAIIEGRNRETRELKNFAICEGWNFVNFEWSAVTPMPMSTSKMGVKDATMTGDIFALALLTRDKRVEVRRDGKIVLRDRTDDEKKLHLAGFGR